MTAGGYSVRADSLLPVVISLGGSLIIPETIDTEFISAFKTLILERIAQGQRFFIIIGGGKTCRNYQSAAKTVNEELTDEDLDWVGIHSTRFNAEFMRVVFKGISHEDIVTDPQDITKSVSPVVFGAGWKPGWSTDYDAVELAKQVGACTIINLSNIDYAYDKDPKTNPDAQPIRDISWDEYRKLIPEEWNPGLNSPFDPVASKEAQRLGFEVAIMNGKHLENLKRYLDGESFAGTSIHP